MHIDLVNAEDIGQKLFFFFTGLDKNERDQNPATNALSWMDRKKKNTVEGITLEIKENQCIKQK